MNNQTKIGLSVVETAWLLQKTEAQVRGMLRRGQLSYAVDGRLVAIDEVEALLPSGFAVASLRWLLSGLISAPRPLKRWGQPAPLFDALDALVLARPALVVNEVTGESEIVPALGPAVARDTE